MAKAPGFAAGSLLGLLGLATGYLSQYAFNVSAARVISSPNLAGKLFQTIAFVQFLAIVGRAGLDRVALRTFGAAHGKHCGTDLHRLWQKITFLVVTWSVVIALVAYWQREWVLDLLNLPIDNPDLPWLFLATPFLALSFTSSQALRGVGWIGKATLSQLTLVFAPPAVIIAGIKLFNDPPLSILIAIWVCFTMLAAVAGYIWTLSGLRRTVPSGADLIDPALAGGGTKIPSGAFTFFLLGLLGYTQAGLEIVLLGAWSNTVEVTRYIATARSAMFVGLGLVAIASVLGRLYAAAHASQDYDEMRVVLNRAGRWALSFALVSGGCLLLGHQLILELFGINYFPNALACFGAILVGHTVNAGAGGLFLLLQMTGKERASTICLVVATTIAMVAYWFLIPKFGSVGAASGLSLLIVCWNLFMAFVAKRALGLQPFSTKLGPTLLILGAAYGVTAWLHPVGILAYCAVAGYAAVSLWVVWKFYLIPTERTELAKIIRRFRSS